jgi:hypothetical protein
MAMKTTIIHLIARSNAPYPRALIIAESPVGGRHTQKAVSLFEYKKARRAGSNHRSEQEDYPPPETKSANRQSETL